MNIKYILAFLLINAYSMEDYENKIHTIQEFESIITYHYDNKNDNKVLEFLDNESNKITLEQKINLIEKLLDTVNNGMSDEFLINFINQIIKLFEKKDINDKSIQNNKLNLLVKLFTKHYIECRSSETKFIPYLNSTLIEDLDKIDFIKRILTYKENHPGNDLYTSRLIEELLKNNKKKIEILSNILIELDEKTPIKFISDRILILLSAYYIKNNDSFNNEENVDKIKEILNKNLINSDTKYQFIRNILTCNHHNDNNIKFKNLFIEKILKTQYSTLNQIIILQKILFYELKDTIKDFINIIDDLNISYSEFLNKIINIISKTKSKNNNLELFILKHMQEILLTNNIKNIESLILYIIKDLLHFSYQNIDNLYHETEEEKEYRRIQTGIYNDIQKNLITKFFQICNENIENNDDSDYFINIINIIQEIFIHNKQDSSGNAITVNLLTEDNQKLVFSEFLKYFKCIINIKKINIPKIINFIKNFIINCEKYYKWNDIDIINIKNELLFILIKNILLNKILTLDIEKKNILIQDVLLKIENSITSKELLLLTKKEKIILLNFIKNIYKNKFLKKDKIENKNIKKLEIETFEDYGKQKALIYKEKDSQNEPDSLKMLEYTKLLNFAESITIEEDNNTEENLKKQKNYVFDFENNYIFKEIIEKLKNINNIIKEKIDQLEENKKDLILIQKKINQFEEEKYLKLIQDYLFHQTSIRDFIKDIENSENSNEEKIKSIINNLKYFISKLEITNNKYYDKNKNELNNLIIAIQLKDTSMMLLNLKNILNEYSNEEYNILEENNNLIIKLTNILKKTFTNLLNNEKISLNEILKDSNLDEESQTFFYDRILKLKKTNSNLFNEEYEQFFVKELFNLINNQKNTISPEQKLKSLDTILKIINKYQKNNYFNSINKTVLSMMQNIEEEIGNKDLMNKYTDEYYFQNLKKDMLEEISKEEKNRYSYDDLILKIKNEINKIIIKHLYNKIELENETNLNNLSIEFKKIIKYFSALHHFGHYQCDQLFSNNDRVISEGKYQKINEIEFEEKIKCPMLNKIQIPVIEENGNIRIITKEKKTSYQSCLYSPMQLEKEFFDENSLLDYTLNCFTEHMFFNFNSNNEVSIININKDAFSILEEIFKKKININQIKFEDINLENEYSNIAKKISILKTKENSIISKEEENKNEVKNTKTQFDIWVTKKIEEDNKKSQIQNNIKFSEANHHLTLDSLRRKEFLDRKITFSNLINSYYEYSKE